MLIISLSFILPGVVLRSSLLVKVAKFAETYFFTTPESLG